MTAEEKLTRFVCSMSYDDLPQSETAIVKKQLLTYFGCVVSGSSADGCEAAVDMIKRRGGTPESTVLVHGGRVPVTSAAFANAVMGRALDICDHIQPGLHVGSSVIPASIATAELSGGCSGRELMAAVAVGSETALRLNRLMGDDEYNGLDPTGVCAAFAGAAAASKLLGLTEKQTLNALGLALSRAGGSYQNNTDGCLGVRLVEGWTAQAGIDCALLAQRGLTGPKNFLDGVYGFCHIYGKDRFDGAQVVEGIGEKFHISTLNFKKYPSCGLTQGGTELILDMQRQYGLRPEDIQHITADVPLTTYNLVGKPFALGDNPRVDAQFGLQYCVANALYRREIRLSQFDEELIRAPELMDFAANRVTVTPSLSLADRKHYSIDYTIKMKDGRTLTGRSDVPCGTPAKPMSDEDFRRRFYDSMDYGAKPYLIERADENYAMLLRFDELESVGTAIAAFTPGRA